MTLWETGGIPLFSFLPGSFLDPVAAFPVAGRSARRSGGLTIVRPAIRDWRRRLAGAARGERFGLLGAPAART